MTIECRKVMDGCGFTPTVENVRKVEEMLMKVSPDQLVRLVLEKDSNGEHDDPSWFQPFIDRGYVRGSKIEGEVTFDDRFWKCYEAFDIYCDKFRTFHFPIMDDMKEELPRVIEILDKSRIKSVPYVYAVYQKTDEEIRAIENNIDVINESMSYEINPEFRVRKREPIGSKQADIVQAV